MLNMTVPAVRKGGGVAEDCPATGSSQAEVPRGGDHGHRHRRASFALQTESWFLIASTRHFPLVCGCHHLKSLRRRPRQTAGRNGVHHGNPKRRKFRVTRAIACLRAMIVYE